MAKADATPKDFSQEVKTEADAGACEGAVPEVKAAEAGVEEQFLRFLREELGVRGLVLDVVGTLVTTHCRGFLARASLPAFLDSITGAAQRLLRAALRESERGGLHLGIVTFTDEYYLTFLDRIPGHELAHDPEDYLAGAELVHAILDRVAAQQWRGRAHVIAFNPSIYREDSVRGKVIFRMRLDNWQHPQHLLHGPAVPSGAPATGNGWGRTLEEARRRLLQYPPLPEKEHHLRLFAAATGLRPEEICLLDDTLTNVDRARSLGCWAVHASGLSSGLQAEHLSLAMRQLRKAAAG